MRLPVAIRWFRCQLAEDAIRASVEHDWPTRPLGGRSGIDVVIRIEERDQYRVGKVEIGGDLIEEPENLLKVVKLTSG